MPLVNDIHSALNETRVRRIVPAGSTGEVVFSCYRPVDPETPVPADQRELSDDDWKELLWLAHADKTRAFERYAEHYPATEGSRGWSIISLCE